MTTLASVSIKISCYSKAVLNGVELSPFRATSQTGHSALDAESPFEDMLLLK